MFKYLLPLFMLIGPRADAQVCIDVVPDLQGTPQKNWIGATRTTDGSLVGIVHLQSWPIYDFPRVSMVKMDVEGNVLWQKMVFPLNPAVPLSAQRITATSDGGVLINGVTDINYFILKVDANGDTEWGRYYMMDNLVSFGWENARLVEMPDGGIVYAVPRTTGVALFRLDAEGVPVSQLLYSTTGLPSNNAGISDLIALPDNSLTVFAGEGWSTPWLFNVAPDGSVNWSTSYPDRTGDASMDRTSDGYVYSHFGHLCKLDDEGGILWSRTIPDSYLSQPMTMPSGEIVVAMNRDVIHFDEDGNYIGSYELPSDRVDLSLVPVGPDSMCLLMASIPYTDPGLLLIPGADALACTGTPALFAPDAPTVSATPLLMTVQDDSIKTWTMALGDPFALELADLATALSGSIPRPGFDMVYYGAIANLGGTTTGPITATLDHDPSLTVLSVVPPASSQSPGQITWTLPALDGWDYFTLHQFQVELNVPVATPLGDVLTASLDVTQDSTEVTLVNNTVQTSEVVVGSYDPNDKLSWPRDTWHFGVDSVLDYTIRFQNTGTAEAYTVVVIDTLPVDLDVSTFRIGAASHPFTYSLTGNGILTVTFADINLPDSSSNEPESHGQINFRIRPFLPVELGQVITNVAQIYFDFNSPIHTPPSIVTVLDPTVSVAHVARPLVQLHPVPAEEWLSATLPEGFVPVQQWAVSADGRQHRLRMPPGTASVRQLFIGDLPVGHYVLTLFDASGRRMAARFVKR